jgi:hypothetical protein
VWRTHPVTVFVAPLRLGRGHENNTARTVAIYEGETLNARALRTMFERIIANNRAGGWRRLTKEA